MNYLLDSCVISDFFKKIPSVTQYFEATAPNQMHISSISVMEIEYGLKLKPEREIKLRPTWKILLKLIKVIPYTLQCAEATAGIRAILKNEGSLIGPYDLLLAGTAVAHGMVFVTSNCKEFKRVSNLIIEDWRS